MKSKRLYWVHHEIWGFRTCRLVISSSKWALYGFAKETVELRNRPCVEIFVADSEEDVTGVEI